MDLPELYVPHAGWFKHEPGDDVAAFLAQGWFEYKEQAFLWLYLRPGDTFLDAGAHVGLFSVIAGGVLDNSGVIFSIEPHPGSVSLLDRNLRANEVTCGSISQLALLSRPDQAILHTGGIGKAAYSSVSPLEGSQGSLTVDVTTLDTLLASQAQLAKIDVEGAELEVLSGAARSIQLGRLPVLLIECTESNLNRFGSNTEALFLALGNFGYSVCRFDPESCQLIARDYEGAIGYDNLFAVQELAEVNQRLSTAAESNRRIAKDILIRGAASEGLRQRGDQLEVAQRKMLEARSAAQDSERRAEEARKRVEQAALSADEAYRRLGEANWRADEAEKRAEAAEKRTAAARTAGEESERRAEEGRKRAEGAAQAAEVAFRALGEANWRAEQAEKRALVAGKRADDVRRQAEDLLRSAELSLRRLGGADWRVEQAEDRAHQSHEAVLQSAALAAEMRLRLDEVLRSRYLHVGWKLGLAKKPAWVDAPLPHQEPVISDEPVETEMMRALRHLDEKRFRPKVVLDIGAGKGYWSILTGGYFRESKFYLLEPLRENEPDLRELCEKDPRQHYILTGVGETVGTRTIQVASELDSSTMLIFPGADPAQQRTLNITTVDQLIREGRIEKPDLVKIDVQGMELEVLRGCLQLFDYTDVFVVEVNLFSFLPRCPRVHEIVQFMAERNYYLFDLAGSLRRPFENDLGQLDLVFVSAKSPLTESNRWL